MISRRLALSALPLLLAAARARAQNFPAGQVRIVVPFPPGGATDVLGRVLATHLQALWGQTVISDYRPGRRRPDRHAPGDRRAGRRPHAADGLDRRDPCACGRSDADSGAST